MSFISVLIVLVILSITVATGYLAISPAILGQKAEVSITRMEVLREGILRYKSNNAGALPATLDVLVVPQSPACTADNNSTSATFQSLKGWCGPYVDQTVQQAVDEFKQDGWGTFIEYTPTTLKSCGPDRVCGNGDDIVLTI